MKKIILLLVSLLVMTACSNTKVTLESPEELFTIDGKIYTEEDVFNQILEVDYGQFLIQTLEDDVIETILEDAEYDVEEAMEKEFENFVDYAISLDMDISELVVLYGFKDVPEFQEQLRRSAIMDLFAKEEIQKDLEGFTKKYNVTPLKAYLVDSEETAIQMLRYVESEFEMDAFEAEFGLEDYDDVFYHEGLEGLSEELKLSFENIKDSKITYEGISEEQFVVYLYNDETINEDDLTQFILNETNFSRDMMIGKIKEGNLTIHNKILKDNMTQDFSEYLK